MLDGAVSGCSGEVNDQAHTTATNSVDVGTLDSSPNSNAIIAFNQARALTVLDDANWTSGTDQVSITFPEPVVVPVAIWIVSGDFDDRFWQAWDGLDMAWDIFSNDAVGIEIQLAHSTDVTGDAPSSGYYHYTDSSDFEDWKTGIGFYEGEINIYMIETSKGETWKAQTPNFRDVIMVGNTAVPEVMVHEIGHSLSLRHTNSDSVNFDKTNVMWTLDGLDYDRDQLTEGQIFRMHTDVNSSLNGGLMLVLDCRNTTARTALQMRIVRRFSNGFGQIILFHPIKKSFLKKKKGPDYD